MFKNTFKSSIASYKIKNKFPYFIVQQLKHLLNNSIIYTDNDLLKYLDLSTKSPIIHTSKNTKNFHSTKLANRYNN